MVVDAEMTQASRAVASFLAKKGYTVGGVVPIVATTYASAMEWAYEMVRAVEGLERDARSTVYHISEHGMGASAWVTRFLLLRVVTVAGEVGVTEQTGGGASFGSCANGNIRSPFTSIVGFSTVFSCLLELAAAGVFFVAPHQLLTTTFNSTRKLIHPHPAQASTLLLHSGPSGGGGSAGSGRASPVAPKRGASRSPTLGEQPEERSSRRRDRSRSKSRERGEGKGSQRSRAVSFAGSEASATTTGTNATTRSQRRAELAEFRAASRAQGYTDAQPSWSGPREGFPIAMFGLDGHWARYLSTNPAAKLTHVLVVACPCCGKEGCYSRKCASGGNHPQFLTIDQWKFTGETLVEAKASYARALRNRSPSTSGGAGSGSGPR